MSDGVRPDLYKRRRGESQQLLPGHQAHFRVPRHEGVWLAEKAGADEHGCRYGESLEEREQDGGVVGEPVVEGQSADATKRLPRSKPRGEVGERDEVVPAPLQAANVLLELLGGYHLVMRVEDSRQLAEAVVRKDDCWSDHTVAWPGGVLE